MQNSTVENKVIELVQKKKTCKKCRISKSVSNFYREAINKDGYTNKCKTCFVPDEFQKEKTCARCGSTKPLSQFHNNHKGLFGKKSKCNKCCSEIYKDPRNGTNKGRPDKVKRLYGVTYDHVVKTLNSQFGRCANIGCSKEISLDIPVGPNRAVIDHNHDTGEFRAVLCMRCNTLLGALETESDKILGLMDYLNKNNKKL